MYGKGKCRGEGVKLALYLITPEHGERAELIQMHGFGPTTDLIEAFRIEEIRSQGTKAEKPFFHSHFRSVEGEGKRLTRAQWLEIADRHDRALGLVGQPGAASLHIDLKTGDMHMHLARGLVTENQDGELYVKKLGLYKNKLKHLSREIERDFGLKIISNERKHRARAADPREHEEGRRLGIDTNAIRDVIFDAFEKSDNGKAFAAAMKAQGFELAAGNRANFVVIDHAGGHHALNKKLTGMTLEEIRQRLSDLDRSQLPTVDQAKELQTDRKEASKEQARQHAVPEVETSVGEAYRQYIAGASTKVAQEQSTRAAPSASDQSSTRTTELQRAPEASNSSDAPRSEGGEKNYSRQSDELAEPVGFWGRIAGWFQNLWRPTSPEMTSTAAADEQKLAGYFDQASRDRVLDGIRHDDAERQAENIKAAEPEKDVQPSLAERFGHNAVRDSKLGPVLDASEDEIKAAKLAAIRRHRAEVEKSIEQRARDPDRGYEME